MTKWNWIFSLFVGVIVLSASAAWLYGVRYNQTTSYPKGFYLLTDKNPIIGDLVLACLPSGEMAKMAIERDYLARGFCTSGTIPLIKKLAALGGDTLRFNEQGLSINDGPVIPNTQQLTLDPSGRILPLTTRGIVSTDTAFLISDYNANSFDSRYFGEVPFKNIAGVVQPLKTWE